MFEVRCLKNEREITGEQDMTYLQFAAAGLAFVAAAFWLSSASVKLPKKITSGYGGVGGTAQELGDAITRQSRRSACAAVSAGVASICEGLFLFFSSVQ